MPITKNKEAETQALTLAEEKKQPQVSAPEAAGADPQTVPRSSAAGIVNKKGEIVDESDKVIGKVSDSKDLQSLVGSCVTAEGDVINESGDVLGKASLDSEYTTQATEEAKDAAQTVSSLSGGKGGDDAEKKKPSSGSGDDTPSESANDDASKATEPVKDDAGKTAESVDDKVPSPVQLQDKEAPPADAASAGKKTKEEKGTVHGGNTPAEKVGQDDLTEQAPKPIDESAEGTTEDASKVAGDKTEQAEDTAEEAKDTTEDTPEQAKNTAEDRADKAKELTDEAQEAAKDITDKGEDAGKDAGDVPEGDKPGDDLPEGEGAKDAAEGVGEQGEGVTKEGEEAGEAAQDKVGEAGEEAAEKADEAGEEAGEKAEEAAEEAPIDFSVLKGTKVNKAGNLVDDKGDIIGRLSEGDSKKLQGKTADEDGNIWNDLGKIVGRAEPIPDSERESSNKLFAPFQNFPDAVVEADGRVTSESRQVGTVVEGDPKRLKGSKVDEDGDILDRRGNVVGKAEAWDEPEEEPEPVVDRSLLAGKRVNKAGNVVDSNGTVFGRVIEGNAASLVGRMCDKEGNIMSESGDKIGKAELVPEGEREGSKEGPFAELKGCTVAKDGKVVTSSGEVVGRLTSGDPKTLYGRSVDEDGDVVDKNGNVVGKAERWEEPEVEKRRDPLAGRKVNREGNVLDDDGHIIGKLTSGDVSICSGKEVDDDGDVVNSKGNTVGHVTLLEDIPGESEEDKQKREQAEKDQKLAGQLAGAIEQSLEKIRPILSLITSKVDAAEKTDKEDLDEEQLVREVKPLIEEGGKILTETNGMIRGMDPDGRIQRQAKHKSATKDASPEEHHLADVLKELTGTVTQTIDNAKRKIDGMPHAKKELNPLWGLLSEPLFQILAAVGLLLNGVLGLVGKLLSPLGLGGLVHGLLGSLGLNKILDGLGLGSALNALTGKKDKPKQ
ncbi:lea domain-containingprotein [Purpureocillium lilacinum]|uniref:Lea domain-containingprotein n=1 Tax=Purpureocillium lilacinum TaxID=33203 RepID=A0A179FIX7_PURLI|nr:lea domain-containingprotein [Purpureocillium lilacinum]OAQ65595.1 lea domain-containingprotein [Purpureocillium lilacinum]